MTLDDFIGYRNERLIGTDTTLDLWFSANPSGPFVRTRRGIARSAILRIVPSEREDIGPASKELAKEIDFLLLRAIFYRGRWNRASLGRWNLR
jgi:hypothetical protein